MDMNIVKIKNIVIDCLLATQFGACIVSSNHRMVDLGKVTCIAAITSLNVYVYTCVCEAYAVCLP